jgi:hypothetical protein
MSFEEMVVAVVGAIGAFALVGYLAAKTFGLIKTWINRNKNSIPEEEFDRLAKAFIQYKKDTERRLQNLETIISEQDPENSSGTQNNSKQIEASKQNIEIENQETEEEVSQSEDSNNLRNMLRD